MALTTKINFFLIVNFLFLFASCENDNLRKSIVPDVRVDISLNIITTPNLQNTLSPHYINITNSKKVGYLGHGIYITKINSKEYKAFDASCTYQSSTSSHTEIASHLLQKTNNPIIIYCPECKSEYNLVDGNLQTGPTKNPLKEYRVSNSGNKVRIYN